MASLASQIQEDRQTLIGLIDRFGISRNPAKQAGAWAIEKISRVKFAGVTSADAEVGTFMALESLALGVKGKLSLWQALDQVAGQHPALASVDLPELIARVQSQYEALERERLAAGGRALARTPGSP